MLEWILQHVGARMKGIIDVSGQETKLRPVPRQGSEQARMTVSLKQRSRGSFRKLIEKGRKKQEGGKRLHLS